MVNTGPIAVLGAGSWGTAVAASLARHDGQVRLWARDPAVAAAIGEGLNPRYLKDARLPSGIDASADLGEVVRDATTIVLGVPAAATAEIVDRVVPLTGSDVDWILLAKGLERGTGRRLSEVVVEHAHATTRHVFALLGPSHAEEVVRAQPTAIVLAGQECPERTDLQRRLSGPGLRVYTNDDLIGVEIAAAVKNVLAIAAGLGDGLGLGDNGKGALLTRGVAELARLGVALGGRRDTFFGLSGVGDVVTTCLSRHSRNRALGERIARGETLEESLNSIGQVVEGVATTKTVVELADARGVAVPIAHEVAAVLFEGKAPREALDDLMQRSLKGEWEDAPPEDDGEA